MNKLFAKWSFCGLMSLLMVPSVMAATFDQSLSDYGLSLGALLATLAVLLIQFNSQRSPSGLLVALAALLTIVLMAFPSEPLVSWSLWGAIGLFQSIAHYRLYQEVPSRRLFTVLASLMLLMCALSEYVIGVGMAWLALPMLLSAVVCFGDGWNEYSALIEQLEQEKAKGEQQMSDAGHDAITGLPNAMKFERLGDGIIRRQDVDKLSLLLVKLSRFDQINKVLGHSNGDLMLAQAGQRIQNRLKAIDSVVTLQLQDGERIKVACLGGVNFGILINTGDKIYQAQKIAKDFIDNLMEPLVLQGCALEFGVAAGIACYPEHGSTINELVNHAHDAIAANENREVQNLVYSPQNAFYTNENIALMAQLRQAISEQQLLLHVQPVIDLTTNEVTAGEAFVRWRHPEKGLIQPHDFVELAEQTGVLFALTQWILEQAIAQLKSLKEAGLEQRISVNIGNSDLMQMELIETIEQLAKAQQVDVSRLTLEIKESALLAEPEKALEMMQQLDQRGIGIALDDFGSGYMSLAYLRQLPISEVKIDSSFVADLGKSSSNNVITSAIIDIARKMELTVVAEGVEDEKVANRLKGMGCSQAQGFYYSRPFELAGFTSWVQQRQS